MPRVPTLSPAPILAAPRPQVRQQAPDAEAFGAGLGRGIEQANRIAFGVWRQEMDRANEAKVLEADTADAKHDLDAWTKLEQVQGVDAPKAFDEAVKTRQQQQAEIEKGLSNPVQREAFRRSAANRLHAFESRGAGLVVRETRRADTQAMDAAVALSFEQAKVNRDDTLALGNGFIEIRAKWNAWADRQGLPAEERQRQQQALQDGYIGAVVQAHVAAENDLAAAKFIDRWGGHLSPSAKERLGKMVETSSTKGQAMRLADKAFADRLDPTAGRAWLIEQAGDNPELRDMAIQRWEGHRAAAERALQEDQHTAYAAAFAILEDPSKDYASLPAPLLERLAARPDLKRELMNFAAKTNRSVSADEGAIELVKLHMLAYEDPEAFKRIDPLTLAGKLPKDDAVRITSAIMEARGGKLGKELKSINTVNQALNDAYVEAGVDPKKNPEDAIFLRQMLNDRMLAAGISADDTNAPEWIRKETARLLVRVALDPRNGKRTDTVEWRRAQKILQDHAENDPADYTALMAEAGNNMDKAVRMLIERQRIEAEKQAMQAKPSTPSALLLAGGVW